jgi:taurine dioxygenase
MPDVLPQLRHPTAYDMQRALLHAPQLSSRDYRHITVAPVSGAIGAEVTGIALGAIDDAAMGEVVTALADHLVLVFPGQTLAPADQVAFARRLGPVNPWPYARPMAGYHELTELVSGPADIHNFGGGWHTDSSTFPRPPAYTVLQCIEGPDAGGDTSFANQYLAWDTLPEDVRRGLEGRRLIHATAKGFGDHSRSTGSGHVTTTPVVVPPEHEGLESRHPVGRTHPLNGRRALYVNAGFAARFEGHSVEESQPLLDALAAHGGIPEFTCRVRWRPGTLVVWDNRCCLHYAHNDYRGQRRVMRRAVVEGEVPV